MQELKEKIQTKSIRLGVIGLGYVGLPLACEFAKMGIEVIGFEVNTEKVDLCNKGISYIQDISNQQLAPLVDSKKITATTNFSLLSTVDVISICVPTPLRKSKDPDMSYIISSIDSVKENLRSGHVVILESTTYPGTTDELILPKLEETGLKVGEDFYLAFSPERVDPGNETYQTHNTPKVLGGVTTKCSEICELIYKIAIDNIVLVSSARSAELVKIYENTFRSVNIALANEMVTICNKLNVDVWEVIDAAATKPFGFMPFYPGPGLGGHCIPIDPSYLSWKLKSLDYDARFIALADNVNSSMPNIVIEKVTSALNDHKKSVNGSKILIIGIAYKPNINDMRESPAIPIIQKLNHLGAELCFHDTLNPLFDKKYGLELHSQELSPELIEAQDCVLVITNHKGLPLDTLVNHAKLIVDTRNVTKNFSNTNIVKL